jgi:hypothetical protein
MSHTLDPGSGINVENDKQKEQEAKEMMEKLHSQSNLNKHALVTWVIVFVTIIWALLVWAGWNAGVVPFVSGFGEHWPGMNLWEAIWLTVFVRAVFLVTKTS